jgi:hypothetical protein
MTNRTPVNNPDAHPYTFDVAAVIKLIGTKTATAETLGVSRVTLDRYIRLGLDPFRADDAAIRAGFHPSAVWPEWSTA